MKIEQGKDERTAWFQEQFEEAFGKDHSGCEIEACGSRYKWSKILNNFLKRYNRLPNLGILKF